MGLGRGRLSARERCCDVVLMLLVVPPRETWQLLDCNGYRGCLFTGHATVVKRRFCCGLSSCDVGPLLL